MDGSGTLYPVYRIKIKRMQPASDWAGVGSLNHAAMARKKAFMTKATVTTRRKNMLPSKRKSTG